MSEYISTFNKLFYIMAFGFVLNLLGFGVKGIIKGSIAAGIQSWYGLVAAGSLFAKLTAAGMRG